MHSYWRNRGEVLRHRQLVYSTLMSCAYSRSFTEHKVKEHCSSRLCYCLFYRKYNRPQKTHVQLLFKACFRLYTLFFVSLYSIVGFYIAQGYSSNIITVETRWLLYRWICFFTPAPSFPSNSVAISLQGNCLVWKVYFYILFIGLK